jgi:hypothetical protein
MLVKEQVMDGTARAAIRTRYFNKLANYLRLKNMRLTLTAIRQKKIILTFLHFIATSSTANLVRPVHGDRPDLGC